MKTARSAMLIALLAASVQIAGCGYGELIRLYFQEQEYQNDQELIAMIKGALLADQAIRDEPIQVEAYLGAVRLSGTVATPAGKQRAEAIAEQVKGADSVDNDLIVQEP